MAKAKTVKSKAKSKTKGAKASPKPKKAAKKPAAKAKAKAKSKPKAAAKKKAAPKPRVAAPKPAPPVAPELDMDDIEDVNGAPEAERWGEPVPPATPVTEPVESDGDSEYEDDEMS
jgi:hypothetical protein